MVPTPSSVSSSMSTEWRAWPSMMWAAPTPCARQRMQLSILGIMPPAMTPSSMRLRQSLIVSSWILVDLSFLSRSTPGTSVIRMSFSALSAAAISPAAVSALMLSAWPASSVAMVATTGVYPWFTAVCRIPGLTWVTSPTNPMSSSFIWRARSMPPSLPLRPSALPPRSWMSATSDLFTRPPSTISTMSMVGPSVTRSPFLKLGWMPTLSSHELISGPPPCTSTVRTPTSDSSTMSVITPALREGSFMAAPPYLMTTVLPAKRCR
mmetsp:Transcript_23392/g.59889  ORF Transcript_23392/g.59889 Transcript_23392/m.59889 type:complete len:265 (+) Transcript_23392:420-1214(+)